MTNEKEPFYTFAVTFCILHQTQITIYFSKTHNMTKRLIITTPMSVCLLSNSHTHSPTVLENIGTKINKREIVQ